MKTIINALTNVINFILSLFGLVFFFWLNGQKNDYDKRKK